MKKMSRAIWLAAAALSLCGVASESMAAPAPKIKVRSASPVGEFYNTVTNAKFTPKGFSYFKLENVYPAGLNDSPPTDCTQHTTFNVNKYDSAAAAAALQKMAADGFNVVRVFINFGDPYGGGLLRCQDRAQNYYGIALSESDNTTSLRTAYVNNFINFLQLAKANNIYVIPILEHVPQTRWYMDTKGAQGAPLPYIDADNGYYMRRGLVEAKSEYARQFVQAVKAVNAGELLPSILSYEIAGEMFLKYNLWPFNRTGSITTTGDGVTYNMNDTWSRQQAADANFVNWANEVTLAIRAVDPNAMTHAGAFTFHSVARQDSNGSYLPGMWPDSDQCETRYPARPIVLRMYSLLSFTSLHLYPIAPTYSITTDLNSSEFNYMDKTTKPFLMGEFGAFKSFRNYAYKACTNPQTDMVYHNIYTTLTAARDGMVAHRNAAVNAGFGAWVYFSWDAPLSDMWKATESNYTISNALK